VNKSLIKFLTDLGPLLVFFLVYYGSNKNLIVAIPPLIITTVIAVIVVYILEKKIPYVPLIGAILISLFGGLSVFYNDPVFLYLKPTIINILFAIGLLIGKTIYNKNFLKVLFGGSLKLEDEGWNKLIYRWIGFFLFMAIINEAVWRTQTEEIWVNFKVWGMLPLTFIFTASQVPLIKKYTNKNE
tara:strand:+ start:880 stop:1434 length:555 start_codon:yes stop_codon:yes gene_type:complete